MTLFIVIKSFFSLAGVNLITILRKCVKNMTHRCSCIHKKTVYLTLNSCYIFFEFAVTQNICAKIRFWQVHSVQSAKNKLDWMVVITKVWQELLKWLKLNQNGSPVQVHSGGDGYLYPVSSTTTITYYIHLDNPKQLFNLLSNLWQQRFWPCHENEGSSKQF